MCAGERSNWLAVFEAELRYALSDFGPDIAHDVMTVVAQCLATIAMQDPALEFGGSEVELRSEHHLRPDIGQSPLFAKSITYL